jgi:hypothetical protein
MNKNLNVEQKKQLFEKNEKIEIDGKTYNLKDYNDNKKIEKIVKMLTDEQKKHLFEKSERVKISGKVIYLTEHEYYEMMLVSCCTNGKDCPLCRPYILKVTPNQ